MLVDLPLQVVVGSGAQHLAAPLADLLDGAVSSASTARFPDGELSVHLRGDLGGADAYVVQSTHQPVDANFIELLLLADAARRAGAIRLTAVVPYVGYARQDRRTEPGAPLPVRAIWRAIAQPFDRLVAVDPHSAVLDAALGVPVLRLSALEALLAALARLEGTAGGSAMVVVAPDTGAVHLADRVAQRLGAPRAVVLKHRVSGAEVASSGVAGDVGGRRPLIVDDIVSTAGTVEAAALAVIAAGAVPEVTVLATHGLFVGDAVSRLRGLPLVRLITCDTVPTPASSGLPLEVVGIAGVLADAIGRLHRGGALGPLEAFA